MEGGARHVVAEVAFVLNTPISALLEMDWREVLEWHDEARRIVRASGGK